MLTAEATIPLADPAAMLARLSAHFTDRASVETRDGGAIFESRFGRAELTVAGDALHLALACPNASLLAVSKMALAEPIVAFAGDAVPPESPTIAWSGADADRADLPYFRELTVVDAFQVTPHMRRVVLSGDAAHYLSNGSLHVRVLIPPAGRPPVWPHAGPDGRMVWPSGDDALVPRVYTVREVDLDRGEIAIDVVLHEGATPGGDWAADARPGDRAGLLGPGGGAAEVSDWMLLAGDETALPAIARMLATLPATTRAVVRLEVADATEEQPLPTPADLDLAWLHRGDAAPGTTTLLADAVAALDWPDLPAERIYAWAGCERTAARAIRGHLAKHRALPKPRMLVAAYWRLGHVGVDVEA